MASECSRLWCRNVWREYRDEEFSGSIPRRLWIFRRSQGAAISGVNGVRYLWGKCASTCGYTPIRFSLHMYTPLLPHILHLQSYHYASVVIYG
jgi:hypothetical protein